MHISAQASKWCINKKHFYVVTLSEVAHVEKPPIRVFLQTEQMWTNQSETNLLHILRPVSKQHVRSDVSKHMLKVVHACVEAAYSTYWQLINGHWRLWSDLMTFEHCFFKILQVVHSALHTPSSHLVGLLAFNFNFNSLIHVIAAPGFEKNNAIRNCLHLMTLIIFNSAM